MRQKTAIKRKSGIQGAIFMPAVFGRISFNTDHRCKYLRGCNYCFAYFDLVFVFYLFCNPSKLQRSNIHAGIYSDRHYRPLCNGPCCSSRSERRTRATAAAEVNVIDVKLHANEELSDTIHLRSEEVNKVHISTHTNSSKFREQTRLTAASDAATDQHRQ